MSVIGEAALTAFFDGLFGKLSSSEFLNFVTEKQVRKELKKWENVLRDIHAVLDDVEEKQMKDRYVKNWLADLQDLAYDVDDILDEFATEALGRKLTYLEEPQAIRSRVQRIIPSGFSPRTLIFNNKMMSKIKEITVRLNDLATKKPQFGLREVNDGARSNRLKQRLQPTSLVDETHVYGRQKEKAAIIELILSKDGCDHGVSVIPIIGMGGIGKTTLAQLVYNDDGVKSCFDHRSWVCVSEDFDAVAVTKTILLSISPESCTDTNDLNLLQVRLKEKLVGEKLLLVLDDIWNENYDDLTILLSPFGVGSKILATTRSHNVSSILGTVKTNPLLQLSEEDTLSIFTRHALRASDFSGHPELKEVGENIVKMCNGLPLAAKAIGGLLRTSLDLEVWKEISKSEIWDIPEEKCGIIPALRLSYHHLPPYLKRCFAYCSILPKDYEFGEEEVIMLWEAEGFLQRAKPNTQIADLGSKYFRNLVSRSFFQTSSRNKSRFVMHDLVNDLAQSVAGDICSKLEDNKKLKISKRTRHSSYVRGSLDGMKKFEAFDQAKHLRTFLSFSRSSLRFNVSYLANNVLVDLLPKLTCLRVLSLKGYCIIELPNIFQKLRHLRYLDFSHTAIKNLPESICTLYNLETLLLYECVKLDKLPSNLSLLANLHILEMSGSISMKGMPFGVGKLTNLQRLSNFVLGKGDGHQIQEIKNLLNLKGKLSISGLENIVKAEDAWEAKLIDKSGLETLKLKWSAEFDDTRNKEVEEEVLKSLEPHKMLTELLIDNYGGTKFPIWMANSSLQNLLFLTLNNCKNCIALPSIGKLPLLKGLFIRGMDEFNRVGSEFYGENQLNAFASLERLYFKDMPKWKEWDLVDKQVSIFPNLVELFIINCPQLLGTLPNHLHSLKKLAIQGCPQLVVSLSDLPLLYEFQINECPELVLRDYADFLLLKKLYLSHVVKFSTSTERPMSTSPTLEYCKIYSCKGLTYSMLKEVGLLGHLRSESLRSLEIINCPQLVLLEPNEVEEEEDELSQVGDLCCVDSLRIWKHGLDIESLRIRKHFLLFLTELRIEKCPNIVSFAKNNFPPALKKLTIQDCMNLQCLADEGENISISGTCLLEHLKIDQCPSLISLSLPTSLQHLVVRQCSKLASLSASGKLPSGLKKLMLFYCQELQSVAQAIDENTCLESIYIGWCGVKSLPQGLDKLNHLQKIELRGCQNLFSLAGFLPTTNLTELLIYECENLRALPNCMLNLTSLQQLEVQNDSGDQMSIPEEGISINLTSLTISVPRNYESLLEWGLHRLTFLKRLRVTGFGCPNMVSFPPEEIGMMLPPSLTDLSIENFKNLKCLSSKGFQNLTSLDYLCIFACPKVTSLPEKDTILSLLALHIDYCPLLTEECKRGKGREWSKIAHIPRVEFHDEESDA